MTSEIYTLTEIKNKLAPVFDRYHVRRAVIFGSYGKSTATEKSDVDILVDSGLRGLNFIGLAESVRAALGKEIDIFDITHIIPDSQLEREIERTGVLVYEK